MQPVIWYVFSPFMHPETRSCYASLLLGTILSVLIWMMCSYAFLYDMTP